MSIHDALPISSIDIDAIRNHGKPPPLGHALLVVQEVAWPIISAPNHTLGSLAVVVKRKLRTTGPLVPDRPEHGCPVIFIERVTRVNDEKSQILLLFMFLPEDTHYMDGALYPRLQSSWILRRAAGRLVLWPGHLQKTRRHHAYPCIPHPNRPDPWLLVQRDQPVAHECPIGGPRGPPIPKPLKKIPNNQPQLRTYGAEPQEAVLQVLV